MNKISLGKEGNGKYSRGRIWAQEVMVNSFRESDLSGGREGRKNGKHEIHREASDGEDAESPRM